MLWVNCKVFHTVSGTLVIAWHCYVSFCLEVSFVHDSVKCFIELLSRMFSFVQDDGSAENVLRFCRLDARHGGGDFARRSQSAVLCDSCWFCQPCLPSSLSPHKHYHHHHQSTWYQRSSSVSQTFKSSTTLILVVVSTFKGSLFKKYFRIEAADIDMIKFP